MAKLLSLLTCVALGFQSGSLAFEHTKVNPDLVVLGDSHFQGPLGRILTDQFLSDLNNFYIESLCGSVFSTFVNLGSTKCGYYTLTPDRTEMRSQTGQASDIIQRVTETPPRCLVVALGTNYAPFPTHQPLDQDIDALTRIAKPLRTKIFWLGPPDSRRFKKEVSLIDKYLRGKFQTPTKIAQFARYFSIHSECPYPETGGDGVHLKEPMMSMECINRLNDFAATVFANCPPV